MTDDLMINVASLRQQVAAVQAKSRWRHLIGLAVVATVGMAVVAMPAMATDKNGRCALVGPGGTSGGAFAPILGARPETLSSHDVTLYFMYTSWVQGYLSGFNEFFPDTYNIIGNTDMHGAVAWIVNYGRSNPTEDLYSATKALVNFLIPTRQRTESAG